MPQPAPALTISCPDRAAPQTPFPCEVRLAPLLPSEPLVVRVQLPVALFHVSGDEGALFDVEGRALLFRVDPLRDTSRPFRLSLVAERSAAGTVRPLKAELITASGGAVTVSPTPASSTTTATTTIAIEGMAPDGWFVRDLPTGRVTAAALALSCVFLAGIWLLRRFRRARTRPSRPFGPRPLPRDGVMAPAMLWILSAGWLLVMLPAPAESVRSWTAFTATTCTVLDRAPSGVPARGGVDAIADDIAEPMAALRYRVGRTERVSTGFNVRGALRTAWNEGDYRRLTVGADYPCWYDPSRPERVVLHRGPSAAAVFALLPVAGFVAGARWLRREWRA